jgi:hypothetical protein
MLKGTYFMKFNFIIFLYIKKSTTSGIGDFKICLPNFQNKDVKKVERDIKSLIAQMTLEEKASLCSGLDNWHTLYFKE